MNKNGKWESTYLLNKFLKIWYTSFTGSFCSATQQISIILWNLISHYKVYKKPPFSSTLGKITPIYTPLFLRPTLILSSQSIYTSLLLMICIIHPPVFHHPHII